MRTISIGVACEGGIFRAYAADGFTGNNIETVKAPTSAEALVQLFDILAEEYSQTFYDKE